MTPDEVEKTSPLSFNVKPAIDWSKVNPVGVGENPYVTNQYEAMLKHQQELADELERRYEKPNLWNIAAAFAKPQLGGFVASLGSAAQELGKNVEAQRAIAPTVARMRAEVAAGQLPLAQRVAQKDEYQKLLEKNPDPRNWASADLQRVIKLDPTSPLASTLKEETAISSTRAGTASTLQGTSAREQELMKSDPYYIPMDKDLQKDWQTVAEEKNNAFKKGLLDSGLLNQEQVNMLRPEQLQATYESVTKQQAEKRLTDANESGNVLSSSMNNLSQLSTARDLAKSKDMEKLLGIGSGQNAVSALFGYVAHPNDPNSYSRLSSAAQKLAQSDPDLYSKFVVLQKALNTNVTQARETLTTPSNQATSLLQSTYPNVAMPQKSIVNLLDLMAAQTMRDARIAAARQSPTYRDVDPNRFQSSDAFQGINQDMDQVKKDILNNKYFGEKSPHKLYYAGSIFEGVQRPQQRQPSSRPANQGQRQPYTGNDALSQQLGIGQ